MLGKTLRNDKVNNNTNIEILLLKKTIYVL